MGKKEYEKLYYQKNRDRLLEYQRQYDKTRHHQVKYDVLNHYSALHLGYPCCGCCQESDLDKLCIDHIAGDGNKHRKSVLGTSRGGFKFYLWLQKNGYPEGYQTLCKECNRKKETWDGEKTRR
jgi:hypothetical protein